MILLAAWLFLAAFTGAYAGFKGYGRVRWAVLALAGGPLTLAVLINREARNNGAALRETERFADLRHQKVEAAFAGIPNPHSSIAPRRRGGAPMAQVVRFRPRTARPPGDTPPRKAA